MHKHFQYHSPDLPRWSGSIAVRWPNSFSLTSVLFAIITPENNSPNIYAGVIVFWRNFLRKGGAPAANPFSISFCVVLDIWMLLLELLDTSYQKRFGPTIHITMLKMNLEPYFDPRIQLSREFIDEIVVELGGDKNVLVFRLGYDSQLWYQANGNNNIFFAEDNQFSI